MKLNILSLAFAFSCTSTVLIAPVSAQEDNSSQPIVAPIPVVDARVGRLSEEQAFTSLETAEGLAQAHTPSVSEILRQVQQSAPALVDSVENKNASQYILQRAVEAYKPTQSFDVEPKDSIIIPVGQGVINSIITNFTFVGVKTSDKTTIFEPEGGYLYATLKTNKPVSLVMFEEGVLESQIAVTLVPIDAPPTVIDLNVALNDDIKAKSAAFQKQIAEEAALAQAEDERVHFSDERTTRVVQLLTPVAQGDLPRGFSLSNDIPVNHRTPCAIPLKHYAGQRLVGGREVIDVLLIQNDTEQVFQMREEMCHANDVIAIGLYRKSLLQPGEEMEVYILRDKHYEQQQQKTKRRPRLTREG